MNTEQKLIFFKEILQHKKDSKRILFTLYDHIHSQFVQASATSKLYFGTLFSRMAYVLSGITCSGKVKFHLHHFRIEAEKAMSDPSLEVPLELIEEGVWAFVSYLEATSKEQLLSQLKFDYFGPTEEQDISEQRSTFIRQTNVVAIGYGDTPNRLRIIDIQFPDQEKIFHHGVVGRNDIFSSDIKGAISLSGFPIQLSLVDVEVDSNGVYEPKYVVIEPDFLIDVSTVADCFRDQKSPARLSLLKNFMSVENAVPIMLGHIANSFLDTLIYAPHASFEETFPKVFHLNPLGFCCMDNESVKQIMESARNHFTNLQKVVQEGLGAEQIQREECLIEPSFYAPAFGLQGRLDLYHQGKKDEKAFIIELKSGRVFMPNNYGLNATHYAQTLLYDLMLRAVSEFKERPRSYILYSGEINRTLRYAPPVDSLQKEAIHARNQIFLMELQMQKLGIGKEVDLFQQISLKYFAGVKGFLKRDVEAFENCYTHLSPLEKKYVTLFTGFIARELALSKVGEAGIDHMNGLASLWLDTLEQKKQKFSVFSFLTLTAIETSDADTTVRLVIHPDESYLTNFRKGDIAVLYPALSKEQPVLRTQIYKCTILEIGEHYVLVKLRNRQIHEGELLKQKKWHLEHDVLDSGSRAQYRSLYKWMQEDSLKRSVFLGISPPGRQILELNIPRYPAMLEEQQEVFNKMMKAKDRFVLWGPPGTGKTSIMIRHAVDFIIHHTTQNILLLAYTNRAVDEICDAVESVGEKVAALYLRIGSSTGTDEKYRDKLIQNQTSSMTSRKQMKQLIDGKRIVVSTISSVMGKPEIFELKNFHIAIIDEASQILEPMLAGVLPKFGKSILIGDHKQLPAVVTQNKSFSETTDTTLSRIGLTNLRDSYFERMYRLYSEKNWDWAYAHLSMQGRMHEDIMQFVNEHFYDKSLKTMHPWQTANDLGPDIAIYQAPNRMQFIECEIGEDEKYAKVNQAEAVMVAHIVSSLQASYQLNGCEWHATTLGIIVPFRAQLAVVRNELLKKGIEPDSVTVDTVERYQGSARDVIILSTTVNRQTQLDTIVSKNDEGIDRKLNVAMTRAKQQFIMLGTAEVLRTNDVYQAFIERYAATALKKNNL